MASLQTNPPQSYLNVLMLRNTCKQAIMCWVNVCQMCVHHPATVGCWMCLYIRDLAAGAFTLEKGCKSAGGKALNTATRLRAWGQAEWHARLRRLQPATDQPKAALVSEQSNTLSTQLLRRWCHDITSALFIWALWDSSLFENIKSKALNAEICCNNELKLM